MLRFLNIIETAPEMKLFRTKHLPFVVEVADRSFRDGNANGIKTTEILSIIREVAVEFQAVSETPDAYTRLPEEYLNDWMGAGRNDDQGYWFYRTQDGIVHLHSHGRHIVEILTSFDTSRRSFASSSMNHLLRKIEDSSAQMDQNRERLILNAKLERERLDRYISDLENGKQLETFDDDDAEAAARDVLKGMSDVLIAIAEVPDHLREVNRLNRESFNRADRPAVEIATEAHNRIKDAKSKANGYQFIQQVSETYLDKNISNSLDLSIQSIINRIGHRLSHSEVRRLQSFLGEMQIISRGIIEENYTDLANHYEYIQTEVFKRSLEETVIMRRFFQTFSEIVKEHSPTIQDSRFAGLGFVIDLPLSFLNASTIKLSQEPFPEEKKPRAVRTINEKQRNISRHDALETASREARLHPDKLMKKLDVVKKHKNPVSLSTIFEIFEPIGGVPEVAAWLNLAASKVPAKFIPGQIASVILPGHANPTLCLDPVFTDDGTPGSGLSEAIRYAEEQNLLTLDTSKEDILNA